MALENNGFSLGSASVRRTPMTLSRSLRFADLGSGEWAILAPEPAAGRLVWWLFRYKHLSCRTPSGTIDTSSSFAKSSALNTSHLTSSPQLLSAASPASPVDPSPRFTASIQAVAIDFFSATQSFFGLSHPRSSRSIPSRGRNRY